MTYREVARMGVPSLRTILAAAAFAAIMFSVGWFSHAAKVPTSIEVAATACDNNGTISVSDGDAAMTILVGLTVYPFPDSVPCVLRVLNAPPEVGFHLNHTRDTAEPQHHRWGSYAASWAYNGKISGLTILIQEARPNQD
jgi:hypothetical protein